MARKPDPKETEEALHDMDYHEELVEIDEEGNVFKRGQAPREGRRKPSILRDPEGEYAIL